MYINNVLGMDTFERDPIINCYLDANSGMTVKADNAVVGGSLKKMMELLEKEKEEENGLRRSMLNLVFRGSR